MKTILLACCLYAGSLWAQPNYQQLAQWIKQSNLPALSACWDTQVELTINDQDGFYQPAQASEQLGAFFQRSKPSDCQIIHHGTARDQSSYYCINSLIAGGKKYRVYILLKNKEGKYLIQEMRLEPQ